MAYVGIDLGGSKLLAVGVTPRGEVVSRQRRPTGRAMDPPAALDAIEAVVDEARASVGSIDAVGVGFPGLVDHARGVVRSSIMLDGWRDAPLAALLEERLHLPCAVDNDVNAAALWEQRQRGALDMLFVAIGTGIGGALVLGGGLRRGAAGFAGEIGHVSIDRRGPLCHCGRRGCVSCYASGTAIEAAAGLAPGALRDGAARNDPAVRAAIDAGAEALGLAIGDALNLVDVPLVVLSGGVAELGPAYVAAVAAAARRACFAEIGAACVFEAARGGYDSTALGAAELARRSAGQPAAAASRSSATA